MQGGLPHVGPDSCICHTNLHCLCDSSCQQGLMQRACSHMVQMADLLLPSQGRLNCPCQAQQGHRQLLILVVPSQMGQVITRLLCLISAQPTICKCINAHEHTNCPETTSLCQMPALVQRPRCDAHRNSLFFSLLLITLALHFLAALTGCIETRLLMSGWFKSNDAYAAT